MKVQKFKALHKTKGYTHMWVGQQIGIISGPNDNAGIVRWHRLRTGRATLHLRTQDNVIRKLAQIYGVSEYKIKELFNLNKK